MLHPKHHDEIVEEVLKRLKENDLFLKPEKCEFKKEIEFLGMVIGEKGVKMDMTKVEAIMSWPMPKCMKDVQAFLGLANFYHLDLWMSELVNEYSHGCCCQHNTSQ